MQFSEESLHRYEKDLRRRQKQLEAVLTSSVEQGQASIADETQDVADQAVAGYQKEMLFSQSTTITAQLRLVRQALNRFGEGTFGECVHCGRMIGEKRLEALPWTPYCIDCQERLENGEIEDRRSVA